MPGGRIAFVELKRPEGGKVSRLQIEWANRLRGLGFSFYFIHTREGVKEFIDRELLGNRYTGIAFRMDDREGGGLMRSFTPYPHQQAGIDWIIKNPACALFWSMGTG